MTSTVPGDCPLCRRTAEVSSISQGLEIRCSACGHFTVTGSFLASAIDQRLKEKIGFWTRDQNDLGHIPTITSYTVDLVMRLPDKTVQQRAERLLRYGVRTQKGL